MKDEIADRNEQFEKSLSEKPNTRPLATLS